MEMTNTRIVPAPPAAVWAALKDPEALKAAIPGCESMERVGEDQWRATVAAKVGPVSARFSGTMRMTDVVPPTAYTLKFEGQGGAAGFANGEAKVSLAPSEGGQTALTYAVKAQVGGKLAQIGSRLIDGAAAKIANDFFERFSAQLAPTGAALPEPTVGDGAAPTAKGSNTGRYIRYIAIAGILIIMVLLYARVIRF